MDKPRCASNKPHAVHIIRIIRVIRGQTPLRKQPPHAVHKTLVKKMSNTVIKIENLSKIYRLGEIGTGTLSHDLNRWWAMNIRGKDDPYALVGGVNVTSEKATKGEHIAALQDINLEVKQGEVLGIIGKNGAGKSTLLKILSRVTSPTTGSISVKGRLASLLEVGTGFHPEMTGRENIFMNGTIMGMRKWEIARKLDEIVEFAGVAKYLDTPVKRYSSGMKVRLGFAVAAHLEPEILVVDEVLAVGDAEFQKKAIGKMQDVSTNDGRTVLFVSHNMTSVQNLCKNVLILQNGKTNYIGETNNAIREYLSSENSKNEETGYVKIQTNNLKFSLIDITLLNNNENCTFNFSYTENIKIKFRYKLIKKTSAFVILLRLTDSFGNVIFTSWDTDAGIERTEELNKVYVETCEIPSYLLKQGMYYISFAVHTPNIEIIEHLENVISFKIDLLNFNINLNRAGIVSPQLKWNRTQEQ